ncbi:MAG TPA: hypothetical protein VMF65_00415 [Acidimicrobiales bacterium]|nr:hypothetical protein [Acidimicrobiales bacterium]
MCGCPAAGRLVTRDISEQTQHFEQRVRKQMFREPREKGYRGAGPAQLGGRMAGIEHRSEKAAD